MNFSREHFKTLIIKIYDNASFIKLFTRFERVSYRKNLYKLEKERLCNVCGLGLEKVYFTEDFKCKNGGIVTRSITVDKYLKSLKMSDKELNRMDGGDEKETIGYCKMKAFKLRKKDLENFFNKKCKIINYIITAIIGFILGKIF